jgi:GxxExxY protein
MKTRDEGVPQVDIFPEQELTGRILEAASAVHNALGAGFLEKVYENALLIELRSMGMSFTAQHPLQVRYKGSLVGDYQADLLVEGRVLLELKACSALDSTHEAQIMNYCERAA